MKLNEKGSVTLIVLVTVLFIVILLSSFLIYTNTKRRAQLKETEEIAKNYDGNMEKIYNELEKNNLKCITGNETENTETEDKNGNKITIPAGFKVVNPEDNVTDGIVIEDVSAGNINTKGNQFVWIPCTIDGLNNTLKYDRYAFTRNDWNGRQVKLNEQDIDGSYKIQRIDKTSYYYHEAMQEIERKSIEKYGGYYIGRYEVGVDIESKGNIDAVGKIKSGLRVYNYVTREEAKIIAERIYNGKSKLCSSYAWDTALKFIDKDTGIYAVYTEGDNYKGNNGIKNTGYNSKKNIYDMGGNATEWTSEVFSDNNNPCVVRRGKF